MSDVENIMEEWARRVEVDSARFSSLKSFFFIGSNDSQRWGRFQPGSAPAFALASTRPRDPIGLLFKQRSFQDFVSGTKSLATLRRENRIELIGEPRAILVLDAFFHLLGLAPLHD